MNFKRFIKIDKYDKESVFFLNMDLVCSIYKSDEDYCFFMADGKHIVLHLNEEEIKDVTEMR